MLRLKQADLAQRSGISPATIREITNSPRPRRRYGRTLTALSEALDWPAGYLDAVLTGREERPGVVEEVAALRAELEAVKRRLEALERSRVQVGDDEPGEGPEDVHGHQDTPG